MFAAADQIMGWSGWRGSLQCLCAGGFFFFLFFFFFERVTGGLQRARVVAAEVGWGVMT